MARTLFLSLWQLGDRAVLAVLVRSLAVTLLIFAAVGSAYWYLMRALLGGTVSSGVIGLVAVGLVYVTSWLLFRIVAIAVIGVFADDVVVAVERRHYPGALAKARSIDTVRAARMGLASGIRALAVNLLVLPLYFLLLATGFGAPLLFLMANGWLLGRDLGDMVAVRHLPTGALPGWRRSTGIPRFVLGLGIAALLLLPLVGLLAPILGAILATHLYHRNPA